jgi:hypothetical protein
MTENNSALAERFRQTTEELLQLIEKFDNKGFNRKPSPDKWSAGEVAEHLLIFDIRLSDILKTATHPTDREITEKVSTVDARVSNRANKIDAPPFLIPSADSKSVSVMAEKIRAERLHINTLIKETDLSLHSKEFPHRLFGELTAYEWINLIDLHSRRHMKQLQELMEQ